MDLEFNCPKYVDFSAPLDNDDNVDDYFNFDHENGGLPVGQLDFGYASITTDAGFDSPSTSMYMDAADNAIEDSVQQPEPTKSEVNEEIKKKKVLPNICTSLEQWNLKKKDSEKASGAGSKANGAHNSSRTAAGKASRNQRLRQSKRKSGAEKTREPTRSPQPKKRKSDVYVRTAAQTATATVKTGKEKTGFAASQKKDVLPKLGSDKTRSRSIEQARPGHRRTTTGEPVDRPVSHTRNRSIERMRPGHRRTSTGGSTKKPASHHRRTGTGGSIDQHALRKKVISQPPSLLNRIQQHKGSQLKSTEEKEFEKIEQLKHDLAAKRKMAQESFKKAQTSTGPMIARSVQAPTSVAEFNFATDSRLKGTHDEEKDEVKTRNFESQLRSSNTTTSSKQPLRPTIPQPFQLHGKGTKRSRADTDKSENGGQFHSMAEQVIAYSKKTPDRFHNKAKRSASMRNTSMGPPKLTVPHTPQLQTRTRQRPTHIKSQQDVDEEEYEKFKEYQFKARPVNQKIMNNPGTGVPRVEPKEVTRPEEFDLESAHRYHTRSTTRGEEHHPAFHANPIPRGILEQPQGIKPGRTIPITNPQSPAFALRQRIRSHLKDVEEVMQEEEKIMKANPVPFTGIPFQPRLDHRITKMQPFSFMRRDKETDQRKKEKIGKVYEEEKKAREFKANPIPDLSPDLPERRSRGPTRPKPFPLETDERGSKKAEEWSRKIEEELEQSKVIFKANPNVTIYQQPFVPHKSTRALTEINQFNLRVDERCDKREDFENWKKEKEMEKAESKAAWEREKKELERQEVARMRVENVHKAKPVRKYRPVQVVQNTKPLTEPHTPRFSERLKGRSARC